MSDNVIEMPRVTFIPKRVEFRPPSERLKDGPGEKHWLVPYRFKPGNKASAGPREKSIIPIMRRIGDLKVPEGKYGGRYDGLEWKEVMALIPYEVAAETRDANLCLQVKDVLDGKPGSADSKQEGSSGSTVPTFNIVFVDARQKNQEPQAQVIEGSIDSVDSNQGGIDFHGRDPSLKKLSRSI